MNELTSVLVYTTLAGAALPVGGALAAVERVSPRWLERELRHGVLAFGGGVLLAAVALVLVPEGTAALSIGVSSLALVAGGLVFLAIDRLLDRRGTPVSNLMAALLDFAPEAIALGALMASSPGLGTVLGMFIALQNVPEGFNAFREMCGNGPLTRRTTLLVLAASVVLGPACSLVGYEFLRDAPAVTGATMLFASGGILYLIFEDIAPQAQLERHWGPPLGAVLGFCLGMVGNLALGH